MRGISVELFSVALGPLRSQTSPTREKSRPAVGDLRAIAHFDPAADDLVEFAFVLRVTLAHEPVASLREWIALGVGIVHRRNVREMLILEAIALVVFVAQAAEEFGNGKSIPLASRSYHAAVPRKSPPVTESTVFICSTPTTAARS